MMSSAKPKALQRSMIFLKILRLLFGAASRTLHHRQILFSNDQILVSDRRTDRRTDAINIYWAFLVKNQVRHLLHWISFSSTNVVDTDTRQVIYILTRNWHENKYFWACDDFHKDWNQWNWSQSETYMFNLFLDFYFALKYYHWRDPPSTWETPRARISLKKSEWL